MKESKVEFKIYPKRVKVSGSKYLNLKIQIIPNYWLTSSRDQFWLQEFEFKNSISLQSSCHLAYSMCLLIYIRAPILVIKACNNTNNL